MSVTPVSGQLKDLKARVASLYNSATPVDELKSNVRRSYGARAAFEDPVVSVFDSLRFLYIQFAMLRVLLHSYWSFENHSFFDATRQTLVIDHTVHYRIVWFLPALCLRTFTLLGLEKRKGAQVTREDEGEQPGDEDDWLVVRHQDHWSFRSLIEGIPLVGLVYRMVKYAVGIITSLLFAFFFTKLSLLD